MGNGICTRQNENRSIAMLAAQRQLYNEAGWLDLLNLVLLVILPLIFVVLQGTNPQCSWIRSISQSLSLSMLVASYFITRTCKNKKSLAASIQLAFDVYVYSMPWESKLFGLEGNYNECIVEKSKRILSNDKQKQALTNWYTPFVDQMPLTKGIFACQKENYNWDGGLRKRYRRFAVSGFVVVLGIILVIGIINNESARELIDRFALTIPMWEWVVSTITGLDDDLNRLQEIDRDFFLANNHSMYDLQIIQKGITEHRKSAVKIPDVVYRIFKDNDEDREHKIAMMDI